jgi:hypothetical protein
LQHRWPRPYPHLTSPLLHSIGVTGGCRVNVGVGIGVGVGAAVAVAAASVETVVG